MSIEYREILEHEDSGVREECLADGNYIGNICMRSGEVFFRVHYAAGDLSMEMSAHEIENARDALEAMHAMVTLAAKNSILVGPDEDGRLYTPPGGPALQA